MATGAPEQLTPSNIGELLNKPFVAVLDVEEGREYTDANGVDQKYPDRNRVLDAKKSGAAAPAPKPKSDAPAWLQA